MRSASLLPAALIGALIAACDGGAPAEPTPPAPVVVSSVDTLRPGQIARVRGSGLTNLRTLTLDGVAATELVARSDSEAEFRVPSMRACETDMRMAQVSADGSAPIGAVVRVPPSVSLQPGQSRILTDDEMKCLRIAAADEDYVLSAANTAMPFALVESPRMLLSVRVLGTGDAAALASADAHNPFARFSARGDGTPDEPLMPGHAALTGNYSRAPEPFDARYATAVVGDTLRFVDWFAGNPELICSQPVESVPSFKAKVVALSGNVAVVVDLRHSYVAAYLDPTKLGWLRDAAAMTERLLLPTMRSLFAADYAPPAGGGGRFYIMLGSMPPAFSSALGFAYDGPLPTVNVASQTSCARASEMVVSLVSADRFAQPQNQNAGFAAGVFLHEYAHNADLLTSRRDRTQSVLNEGLATLAQETASRIASGQPLGARHSRVGSDAPAISDGTLGMWGTQPELGPWQNNGRYGATARMLLFLRELAGEASIDHGKRPTLYQRFIYAPINWDSRPAVIANLTSVLGIEYTDLTDRHTLASVTAGLIDPAVVHDLPRYTAWDHSERARTSGPLAAGFPGRASRRTSGERTLTAADGGHAALYLMADGPRGISLELLSVAATARTIRLTRLR